MTGGAGFAGSHSCEALLRLAPVVCPDDQQAAPRAPGATVRFAAVPLRPPRRDAAPPELRPDRTRAEVLSIPFVVVCLT
ncbi:hypothetical protein HBB16_21150 [Pseudonocardia sp. MCCB 268]|nr:hypothetical protein [Pseudonocardia cytotoxica]